MSEVFTVDSTPDVYNVSGPGDDYDVALEPDRIIIREVAVLSLGGAAPGESFFVYTPPSSAIEWIVVHPLDFQPNVTVILEDGNRLMSVPVLYDPDDVHRLVISFSVQHGPPAHAILS